MSTLHYEFVCVCVTCVVIASSTDDDTQHSHTSQTETVQTERRLSGTRVPTPNDFTNVEHPFFSPSFPFFLSIHATHLIIEFIKLNRHSVTLRIVHSHTTRNRKKKRIALSFNLLFPHFWSSLGNRHPISFISIHLYYVLILHAYSNRVEYEFFFIYIFLFVLRLFCLSMLLLLLRSFKISMTKYSLIAGPFTLSCVTNELMHFFRSPFTAPRCLLLSIHKPHRSA